MVNAKRGPRPVDQRQPRADESGEWERQAIATSDALGFPTGPFSAAFVATYLAWLRMVTGDPAGARHFGRRTLEIAERCRFDYFQLIGRQYVLVPEPGRPSDATELEQCEAGMDLVGHGAFRPSFLGIVARNHACLGDADRALQTLEDALAGVQASGELIHQPDLLRLRAEITQAAHPDRTDEVIADLVAALEVGLAQGSVVLALQAAIDLARLPSDDRPSDWSDMLTSVFDRFPPGSSSPQVAEARALFGRLTSAPSEAPRSSWLLGPPAAVPPGRLRDEVVPFAHVGGSGGGGRVRGPARPRRRPSVPGGGPARRAGGASASDAGSAPSSSRSPSPASGPSTIARATARLSRTTGLSVICSSNV